MIEECFLRIQHKQDEGNEENKWQPKLGLLYMYQQMFENQTGIGVPTSVELHRVCRALGQLAMQRCLGHWAGVVPGALRR